MGVSGARPALLALVLLVSACERDGGSDPAAKHQPAAGGANTPASFTPLESAPGRFVASSGRISVPVQADPGWECLEARNPAASVEAGAVALRCRRTDPREFLFLAAKTHRQPPDQRTNAKTVLMTLYRGDNERFFESVEYLDDGPATLAGAEGWEAELVAEHARLGSIHKRERLAIVGDRIFSISAEGSPALWRRHADEVERWFAGVEFATGE